MRRYFGLDQVLRASGFECPHLGGCHRRGLEEGGDVGVQGGGGGRLGGEGDVVPICSPNGVALLGVAVRGLGLGLLDG